MNFVLGVLTQHYLLTLVSWLGCRPGLSSFLLYLDLQVTTFSIQEQIISEISLETPYIPTLLISRFHFVWCGWKVFFPLLMSALPESRALFYWVCSKPSVWLLHFLNFFKLHCNLLCHFMSYLTLCMLEECWLPYSPCWPAVVLPMQLALCPPPTQNLVSYAAEPAWAHSFSLDGCYKPYALGLSCCSCCYSPHYLQLHVHPLFF